MAYIPKAVCAPCGREALILKNDIVVEMMTGSDPYYKIRADLYRCPDCDDDFISGWAQHPFVYNYEDTYNKVTAYIKVRLG